MHRQISLVRFFFFLLLGDDFEEFFCFPILMNCQRITIYALLILGYGGGFNERENVEYIEREESDGEYDEVISYALVCSLNTN